MQTFRICFGQQPCGFFPKRYLYVKLVSARKLQKEIGGDIVFFYHDSDADYRETLTVLRNSVSGREGRLNFVFANSIQKQYAPFYAKEIAKGWKENMARQLPQFVERKYVELFRGIRETNVANFCLAMYKEMGLLRDIEIVRSSDRSFREKARELDDCYADISYGGEIVRARQMKDGTFTLHKGGGEYITLPSEPIQKWQKSAPRDLRFSWMQSVIGCTHYIMGEGEKGYLDTKAFPEVILIAREAIERPGEAWVEEK